jgi:hypothetical protein
MGNSVGYKGNPALFNFQGQRAQRRAAAAARAEARLRELEREASPIVVPAPRRKRAATTEPAPIIEATPDVAPATQEQEN